MDASLPQSFACFVNKMPYLLSGLNGPLFLNLDSSVTLQIDYTILNNTDTNLVTERKPVQNSLY